jgi:hypothetical protein
MRNHHMMIAFFFTFFSVKAREHKAQQNRTEKGAVPPTGTKSPHQHPPTHTHTHNIYMYMYVHIYIYIKEERNTATSQVAKEYS